MLANETSLTEDPLVRPFVKWAGGKRQLLPEILRNRPKVFNNYFEPFVGGGAVFFKLQKPHSVINDFNGELINAYRVIQNDVESLLQRLISHAELNSKEYFYQIRQWDRNGILDRADDIDRAARFIYLNKTCFNGLYRVNSKGQFNVPFGDYKNPSIVNKDVLVADSNFLRKSQVRISTGDYAESVKDAEQGDFIYFDPPYAPLDDSQNFVGYTKNGFGYQEQEKLRDLFVELDKRGCYLMLSNSSTTIIHELYKEYKDTTKLIDASRAINSDATGRGKIKEVLITNY